MINYMVDSENVGTKWIPYLKENIKKSDRVFLFYTDKSPSIPCNEIEDLAAFINQIQTIYCHNKTDAENPRLLLYALIYVFESA